MTPPTHPTSRRSAAWAIDSRPDIFSRARLRLTVFYVLLLAVIMAIFSVVVYLSFERDIRDGIEEEISDPTAQTHLIARTSDNLRLTIIIIDGGVLLISGFLGYALAGWTLRPIRKSLEDQRSFSSQASHELRTPLTIIKTESELALRDADISVEELKGVLRSAVDEVGRMAAIVSDLLALSRGEDASRVLDVQPLDLAAAVARICKRMRPLSEAKGVAFACVAGEAAFAMIDEAGLEKLLTNLIQNAINYTPRGGNVSVDVSRQESRLAVSVRDTGVGISTEDLPHVFEAFYKGRHEGEGYAQGAGLGLTIVKRTIDDFGGEIALESQVGKGTKMTVWFKERRPR